VDIKYSPKLHWVMFEEVALHGDGAVFCLLSKCTEFSGRRVWPERAGKVATLVGHGSRCAKYCAFLPPIVA